MPDYTPCPLLGNGTASFLRYLCIFGVIRTDSLPCNCREKSPGRHKISEWCAGAGEKGDQKGTLLGAVRLYLGYLFSAGQLNDETSDEMRRGLLYPAYCFIVWMTNGVDFKARGRQISNGVKDPGSWLTTILGEAKAIGVPLYIYPSAELATALALLGRASRDKLVHLTQAYLPTATGRSYPPSPSRTPSTHAHPHARPHARPHAISWCRPRPIAHADACQAAGEGR